GITALPLFFLSSLMARLLLLIRVGPEQVRLQAWLFDRLFASWLPPIDASLAYALAYVLLWWGLMWALSRTGVRLRVWGRETGSSARTSTACGTSATPVTTLNWKYIP